MIVLKKKVDLKSEPRKDQGRFQKLTYGPKKLNAEMLPSDKTLSLFRAFVSCE
jgi:hypothetical protein